MAKRPSMAMINSRLHARAKAVSAALALAALATATAAAAAAATAPSPSPVAFALSPVGATSSITLRGTAGRVLHGAVDVRNLSGRRITVILQRADIENASNGNADYLTARLYHAGRWLRLASQSIALAPGAHRQITFAVRIPVLAAGGSHYAGIVAINAADLVTHSARGNSNGPAFTFYRISREALPVTIHLPGRLSRSLSLRSAKLIAEPIGASLVLGLIPSGTELTQAAPLRLRVLRRGRTIFTYASTLGQLFPGSALNYRIPWPGRPTPGTYRLIGQIRPQGSAVINIDRTIGFSVATASQLHHEIPPIPQAPGSGTPGWIWIVLSAGATLVSGLSLAVYKLARRPRRALA
jgi:hypothetical protein